MPSRSPEILKFNIENSAGRPLLNSNHPSYEGDWNQTMYAGNEYHLIVEAKIATVETDYIQVDLTNDRDDLTLYYFPRNETAWTDSPHITIVPEGEDSDGPQLLRMDGDYLVNPFTDEFYLIFLSVSIGELLDCKALHLQSFRLLIWMETTSARLSVQPLKSHNGTTRTESDLMSAQML